MGGGARFLPCERLGWERRGGGGKLHRELLLPLELAACELGLEGMAAGLSFGESLRKLLLLLPFCGGELLVVWWLWSGVLGGRVRCRRCAPRDRRCAGVRIVCRPVGAVAGWKVSVELSGALPGEKPEASGAEPCS